MAIYLIVGHSNLEYQLELLTVISHLQRIFVPNVAEFLVKRILPHSYWIQ